MAKIAKMLKEETNRSRKYRDINFGAIGGDDFRPMVDDLYEDQQIAQRLIQTSLDLAMKGIPEFQEYIKEVSEQHKEIDSETPAFVKVEDISDEEKILTLGLNKNKLAEVLRSNFKLVAPELMYLYWGIRIGRRMQEEEDKALSAMETSLSVPSEETKPAEQVVLDPEKEKKFRAELEDHMKKSGITLRDDIQN